MAVELKLSKSDNDTPWGFRLVGGVDFGEPVTVVKVNERSVAEDAGLVAGDILEQINGVSVIELTHKDVHDLIYSAGLELFFVVHRGYFEDTPMTAQGYDNKDENVQSSPNDTSHNITSEKLNGETGHATVNTERQDHCGDNRGKKWSTFLQKPKRPKPVPKKVEEERKIIGEPYRVKIVKQKKRDPNEKKAVRFQNVPTTEEVSETSTEEALEISEKHSDSYNGDNEVSFGGLESPEPIVEEEAMSENCDVDSVDEEVEEIINVDMGNLAEAISQKDETDVKVLKPILKNKPLGIHIEPVIESSLSLEEQLAAVQKQLLALSQLPSAIQVTLEAVTQQLNNIVLAKTANQESQKAESVENMAEDDKTVENGTSDSPTEEGEAIAENGSYSENAEGDITENEDDNNYFPETLDDDAIDELVSSDVAEVDQELVEESEDTPPELTEEEKEAKRREEEILAKRQKEIEERKKMDWAERPIILPGGRRWSGPDDTTPKFKNPRMSDDKISKMIETYSEVIVGKTKGINFLKYQPPPKNLSYLQNSEVYRLIHGMDQPMRGVGVRAEKVLSEKDYYGDNGAP